ncbi:MAG: UDP-3-O-[3-hydroxymyristoyl] N-acetylglucosamine deacetylase [bacterium]|nr:UDP-3-O-[3-hydroxymyristoyl] N-acetylglucosamine deacetylase [bacterium]
MKQTTIKNEFSFKGIGIHSGEKATVTVKPAKANSGIYFIRTDKNHSIVPVNPLFLSTTSRATILQKDSIYIKTPEHFLAACYGLGIDNLAIEIDKDEFPIIDGSALPFTNKLLSADLIELKHNKKHITIKKPLSVKNNNKVLAAFPDTSFKVTFIIDYPDTFIGTQVFSLEIDRKSFIKEISPARTYGFYSEIKALIDNNLARGGSLNNAVVIGENKYLNKLRFDNELVRHKILDLIGDLSVLGQPVHGHFIGFKSGHSLNKEIVSLIKYL